MLPDSLQKIASQLPGVVYQYRLYPDGSHRMPYVSDAVREMFRLEPKDLRDDAGSLFALIHPDDLAACLASIEESRKHLTPWQKEYRIRLPDGEVRWIAGNSVPQRDPDGSTLWHGFLTDVTARKRTDEALQDSRRLIGRIIDAMPVRIFWKNRDLVYLGCNASFARDAGLRGPEDVIGKDDHQMVWREQAELYRADDRQVIESGRDKLLIEEAQTTPDGKTIILLTNKMPLRNAQGEITGVLGTYMDITERRRSESALANMQRLESLGTLAGGIAHDFNNILTAIIGNLSLLQVNLGESGETAEMLRDVMEACGTAKGLSNQLLTFSKGGSPIVKAADLRPLLTKTAGFAARGSNVRCVFDLGDAPLIAKVDEAQFAQVAQNLVLNAVQAMPAGGEIRLRGEVVGLQNRQVARLPAGRYVKLTIKDDGCGISPDNLARIFEPYFSTKATGRGLGLSVCFSIIRKHGGEIQVESSPGRGTVFTVYFPQATEPPHDSQSSPLPTAKAGRGRILIMDDEAPVAKVLKRMLEHLGYRCDLTRDGGSALAAYEDGRRSGSGYDAVILDLTIPGGMGGVEALAKIRALDPEVRAIVASGYSNDAVLSAPAAYGFAAALTKPYRLEALSEALVRAGVSA